MHLFVALSIVTAGMGAARPDVSAVPPPSVASSIAGAAEQVKRCYRSPKVSREARRITTRLLVRYTSDGMLAELPIVLSQEGVTPDSQPFAGAMAEAAILAVIRCTPLRLPPEQYTGGWDEFELTFSLGASA